MDKQTVSKQLGCLSSLLGLQTRLTLFAISSFLEADYEGAINGQSPQTALILFAWPRRLGIRF